MIGATAERSAGALLLTGATGFLGMELLARWLERTDRRIYALVRARDDAEAAARIGATLETLYGDSERYAERVVAIPGDITRVGLGLDDARRDELAGEVSEIVHCAASVSFSLGLEASRGINVTGTHRMLAFAERCRACGGLDRFAHVSTAYVAGARGGVAREDESDVGQRFRNAYERSKLEGELSVHAVAQRLPVQIFRPSIIVGEQETGWTASFNVLYWPLRAFSRGLYPAIPARRAGVVDVVSVDYVADAIFAISQQPVEPGATYHLTSGERATNVGELIDLAARRFGRPAPRVVHPLLFERLLLPRLERRAGESVRAALRESRFYFPYFSIGLRYDDQRARAALEPVGIRPAPLASYFDKLLDYAEAARWGKQPLSRVHDQVPSLVG